MAYDYTLTAEMPTGPQAVFDAWMDSRAHTAMTGGRAEIDPVVGGRFTAWNGYIAGTTLVLEPPVRIVQAWRTTAFADDEPDSEVELVLAPVASGTSLTLRHRKVPEGHPGYEENGWQEHYFAPMQRYFAGGS